MKDVHTGEIAKQSGAQIQSAVQKPSNGMAIAGLVCSIIALILSAVPLVGLILAILGIVFSSIGMSRSKRLPYRYLRGVAIAGLVVGIVATVIVVFMFLRALAMPG